MTGLTLYELTDRLAEMLDQVDESGELPEEYGDVRVLVAEKAAAVAAFIATREMQIDAMKARLKEIGEHVKSAEKRAGYLRQYLAFHMARSGITEIQGPDPLLHVKRYPERDESVVIDDERQIPAVYMNVPEPPAPRPDKAAIKRAIKAGQDVPGAKLVKRDRLVIG